MTRTDALVLDAIGDGYKSNTQLQTALDMPLAALVVSLENLVKLNRILLHSRSNTWWPRSPTSVVVRQSEPPTAAI